MFIDARRTKSALRHRQEGNVRFGRLNEFYKTWPSWRRADASRHRFYKHFPPGGGRPRLVTGSINIALLTEGGRVSSQVL